MPDKYGFRAATAFQYCGGQHLRLPIGNVPASFARTAPYAAILQRKWLRCKANRSPDNAHARMPALFQRANFVLARIAIRPRVPSAAGPKVAGSGTGTRKPRISPLATAVVSMF